MIAILGESASGKTTLLKKFVDTHPQYREITMYTTRPKQEGEIDGLNYHFISQNAFDEFAKRGFFIDYGIRKNWSYGIAKADCTGKNTIAILTPTGLRTLKRLGCDVVSIYLYVDRRSRLKALLVRGDDIDEAYRLNLFEKGQFNEIIEEVDYIIDNKNFHMNEDKVRACLIDILDTEYGLESENES